MTKLAHSNNAKRARTHPPHTHTYLRLEHSNLVPAMQIKVKGAEEAKHGHVQRCVDAQAAVAEEQDWRKR